MNHSRQELEGSFRSSHQVNEQVPPSGQSRKEYQALIQVGSQHSFEYPDKHAYAQLHCESKL